MAVIEFIEGEDCINVEAKVGTGQFNGWSDVTAVQAFLKFFEEHTGIFSPGEVPEPDGVAGATLSGLVLKYQKLTNKAGSKFYRLKEDGIVGRAKGKSNWGAGKKWTIIDMNDHCRVISLAKGAAGTLSGDYIKDLKDRFPSLQVALGTPGVSF